MSAVRDLGMRGSGRVRLFMRGPRGLEPLLAAEAEALGGEGVRAVAGGVSVVGDLARGYRLCYGSRLATRVLWPLASFPARDADALYAGVAALPWAELIAAEASLAVGFDGRSQALRHSGFAARRVKDAVVDTIRAATGRRPSVDLETPDVRLQAVLHRERVALHLDLAGEVLHRRGWRADAGEAPLKENLAAGVLLSAGWPALADGGAALLDPFCGAGTLVVEGAMIAARIPPGRGRERWGFKAWTGHDAALWARERQVLDAAARALPGAIIARDADPVQVRRTQAHLQAAGIEPEAVDVAVGEVEALASRPQPGLVATNPPYGVRLEGGEALLTRLGAALRQALPGWRLGLLLGSAARESEPDAPAARAALNLPGLERQTLYNGPLRCQLLTGAVERAADPAPASPDASVEPAALEHAEMLANRIRKNRRKLERWARGQGIDALRLYDRDLPEYAFAIDRYTGADASRRTRDAAEESWLCVQEYAPPATVDPVMAARRRAAALTVLPQACGVPAERIVVKTRQRTAPREQYPRLERSEQRLLVREAGARLEVNLGDFIDTGLFLDSRPLRRRIRRAFEARVGGRFLNLFAYTCTATVHAALGGAEASTSVDLSPTYLAWGERNLAHNGLPLAQHRREQRDVGAWLADPARRADAAGFDTIFLDVPTFSASKRTPSDLDVQRDHPALLAAALPLLAPGGELVFCTHARRFRLRFAPPVGFELSALSTHELDPDFRQGAPPHHAWTIRRT